MDQDILPKGEPQDGDDGEGFPDNKPFADNDGTSEIENAVSQGEDTSDPAEDAASIQGDMQAAADAFEESEGDPLKEGEDGAPEGASEPEVADSAPAQTSGPSEGFFQRNDAGAANPTLPSQDASRGLGGDIGNSADFSEKEAPPPTQEEIDDISSALGDFGDKLEAWDSAGGEGAAYDDAYNSDYGGDGGTGGLKDFADAVTSNADAEFEFLKEHARHLDDLKRRLEMERL